MIASRQLHRERIRDDIPLLIDIVDNDGRLLLWGTVVEGDLFRIGGAILMDGHRQLLLHGIVHDTLGQLLNLVGHGGTEEYGLSAVGQHLGYLHDVLAEAHVQHAVRFVQDEE